jgi:hypothetical protein
MVANAKLGVVYRREDIDTMGDAGINGQFAPKGKSLFNLEIQRRKLLPTPVV